MASATSGVGVTWPISVAAVAAVIVASSFVRVAMSSVSAVVVTFDDYEETAVEMRSVLTKTRLATAHHLRPEVDGEVHAAVAIKPAVQRSRYPTADDVRKAATRPVDGRRQHHRRRRQSDEEKNRRFHDCFPTQSSRRKTVYRPGFLRAQHSTIAVIDN